MLWSAVNFLINRDDTVNSIITIIYYKKQFFPSMPVVFIFPLRPLTLHSQNIAPSRSQSNFQKLVRVLSRVAKCRQKLGLVLFRTVPRLFIFYYYK